MDGGGIDVWRGSDAAAEIDAIMCVVDLVKRDSEMKILIGCTEDEKMQVFQVHNESDIIIFGDAVFLKDDSHPRKIIRIPEIPLLIHFL